MPRARLTDIAVKAIKPPLSGQETHWDETLPGFGLRVSQGGSRTFVVVHGADRQRSTIGRYPVISLADARSEAKRLLAEVTLGRTRPSSITWEKAVAEFLVTCGQRNRPRTVADYRRLLNRHFSSLGRMQLTDVRTADLSRRLDRLKEKPSERHHAYVVAKILFRWAMRRGYIVSNPCDRIQHAPASVSRERALTDEELAVVLRAARRQPHPFGAIVELLTLTGQRRGEIAGLRWEWINKAKRTITFPSTATKNRRAHVLPYGGAVSGVIEALPRLGDYVFPASRTMARGRATTIFNGWGKAKAALDEMIVADLAEEGITAAMPGWTLHDLRRTFATNLAALGVPVHVTEKLLNHVSGTISGVAAVYNRHAYMEEMRAATALWEAKLAKLTA